MFKLLPAALLLVSFLWPVGAATASGQVNVFIYHRFDESRYPSTNISTEIFARQLTYLKDNDYQVLSLGEVVRRLRAGEALPAKAAALCVDDAFTSFAEAGMPLLRKYGFPVSLFVNTDAVGTSGYLGWPELKALMDEGVEIGNHTASHAYLVEMQAGESYSQWRARIHADISRARAEFIKHLGIDPPLFVYPYGEYSEELVALVKELGFSAAFAQQSGVVHSGHDLYTLPRFPMGGPYATLDGFVSKLRMKPLVVSEQAPYSPVVIDNPPVLRLKITADEVDLRRVNCFAQGENSCRVEADPAGEDWYRVVAEQPLSGRRNKYTLTAPGKKGGWHWYSQQWINADTAAIDSGYKKDSGSALDSERDSSEALETVQPDQ